MELTEILNTVISQAPNLIVAVWMLNNQKEQIKALLENQNKLVDRLLNYVDRDKQVAAAALSEARKPDTSELRKLS
mgnify:CR=1 FL=1